MHVVTAKKELASGKQKIAVIESNVEQLNSILSEQKQTLVASTCKAGKTPSASI